MAKINILTRKFRTMCKMIYNGIFNRPIGYIYMFHMVKPKKDYISSLDNIRVSPAYFKQFLLEKKKQLDFISIEEVPNRINSSKTGMKPFGVVTFDDGYDDNYQYAYPILKQLQIPFVIYVSVNLINDHAPIWNYPLIIERIIRKNAMLKLGNGETHICDTEQAKNEVFALLKRELFSLPYSKLQSEFERVLGPYLTEDIFPQNTLTWEQIEELSKDPLCTIGSHTMSHCRLVMTDEKELEYELKYSKKLLEQHIGKPVLHLSYPYGSMDDVSAEAMEYARNVGYRTAPLGGGGVLRENDKEIDMFKLKRVFVHE